MSPILVRPVREQLEHDRVIRLLRRVLGGEDFSVVARDNSDDSTSGASGGDLGFLSAQQMEQQIGPDFRQAVVRFGDERPCTGDIEVDLRSSAWHGHGHDSAIGIYRHQWL